MNIFLLSRRLNNLEESSYKDCVDIIKNFQKCMTPFYNGKEDFHKNYKTCLYKFKKDIEKCGFKPEDIY